MYAEHLYTKYYIKIILSIILNFSGKNIGWLPGKSHLLSNYFRDNKTQVCFV